MNSPVILAIDTATDNMTVAVCRDDQILVDETVKDKHQAKHLLQMIDRCLKKAKLELANIDAFATTKGPGSFTGIRTSLGTIKGLAYAFSKPIIAIPTMEAMVYPCDRKTTIVPTLPARKDFIYMAIFESKQNKWVETTPVSMIPTAELSQKTPNGALIIGSEGNSKFDHVYGTNLCKISLEKYKNKEFEDVFSLEPLYIQKTAAEGYV